MISKKISFAKNGLKCFICYKDDEKVMPLCIILPKMSGYIKSLIKLNICHFWQKINR